MAYKDYTRKELIKKFGKSKNIYMFTENTTP